MLKLGWKIEPYTAPAKGDVGYKISGFRKNVDMLMNDLKVKASDPKSSCSFISNVELTAILNIPNMLANINKHYKEIYPKNEDLLDICI